MTNSKLFIIIGISFVALGLIINYAPWLINWFGKLPGDIRIENKDKLLFIPITSMLVVSIIFTVIINVFFRD